jgi:lipoprotein-anchoring transpeptidase ErfK/SrfK
MLSEARASAMPRTLYIPALCLLLICCFERREPPGAGPDAGRPSVVLVSSDAAAGATDTDAAAGAPVDEEVLGTVHDSLPFRPDGTQLVSIAWRTWVYTDTGPKRTRYGYLRAGAVVDARGPVIKNAGCEGGWYRINPRGFVCIGKGATLDAKHYAATVSSVRPTRGQGLPYRYAMSSQRPPYLYFKLPTLEQMTKLEGKGASRHAASWRQRMARRHLGAVADDPPPPPSYLTTDDALSKPYGVKQPLRYSVHTGRASPDSGFAIAQVFEWGARLFGITTELDVIALDRTKLVEQSGFRGVELGKGEDLPVAFIEGPYATKFALDRQTFVPVERFADRQGVKLTGQTSSGGVRFFELRGGGWLTPGSARILPQRDSFPSFATGSRKWIDISIKHQTLVAYVGTKAVYATLVSTGLGGMADPEKAPATVRGTFMIHAKHISSTMDGEEDKSDSFNLRDVPFVQYFHKGYALHGTYWHNEFGKLRSHGCVNLSPIDAAWLFEWTDPIVPLGWHGRVNKDRGTVVYIHV